MIEHVGEGEHEDGQTPDGDVGQLRGDNSSNRPVRVSGGIGSSEALASPLAAEQWFNEKYGVRPANLQEWDAEDAEVYATEHAAHLHSEAVKLSERLKHISFVITGNDYALQSCPPQEVDTKIAGYVAERTEDLHSEVARAIELAECLRRDLRNQIKKGDDLEAEVERLTEEREH